MRCPKCYFKTTVLDTAFDTSNGEALRRRKCSECGYEFYSIEFEVEQTKQFKREWRDHIAAYKNKNKENEDE